MILLSLKLCFMNQIKMSGKFWASDFNESGGNKSHHGGSKGASLSHFS